MKGNIFKFGPIFMKYSPKCFDVWRLKKAAKEGQRGSSRGQEKQNSASLYRTSWSTVVYKSLLEPFSLNIPTST